jgi:hypothetical protein
MDSCDAYESEDWSIAEGGGRREIGPPVIKFNKTCSKCKKENLAWFNFYEYSIIESKYQEIPHWRLIETDKILHICNPKEVKLQEVNKKILEFIFKFEEITIKIIARDPGEWIFTEVFNEKGHLIHGHKVDMLLNYIDENWNELV